MKTAALGLFLVTGAAWLTGCQSMQTPQAQMQGQTMAATKASAAETVSGDYHLTTTLDNSPAALSVGHAWVRVSAENAEQIRIQVRDHHAGQKSCYFDGKATLMGQDAAHGIIFQTVASNTKTFLQFKDGKLMIDGQDRYALANLCTGGATLAGNYQKTAPTKFFGHLS